MKIFNFKQSFSLFLLFSFVSNALSAPSYNFFQESSMRMYEATNYLKNTVSVDSARVQQAAYNGSVQELAGLYVQMASATQLRTEQVLSTEAQAAYVALFLEKLRVCYHEHLNKLEAAMPYWEWAKHHTIRYTLSQLPHKWFKHDANQADVEHTYTMICALREVYSAEFGKLIRLLALWHEEHPDAAVWLSEVQKSVASIVLVEVKELENTEALITKLASHEHDMAAMVTKVQAPGWLERQWIPLATATVALGAAAYYYNNNTQLVHGIIEKSQTSSVNFWKANIEKPFYDLKSTLAEAMKPFPDTKDTQQVDNTKSNFDVSEESIKEFQKACDESWTTGWGPIKKFTTPLFNWLRAWNNEVKNITAEGKEVIKVTKKGLEANKVNFALTPMTLACLLTYGTSVGVSRIYGWFTKQDRRALVGRLCQAEQILIRTQHAIELSDAEYGRMLYLLTKAYDQVAGKVFSDERIAFLQDLTYIADTQSSIAQKSKTLESMWRKYRSLEKPA